MATMSRRSFTIKCVAFLFLLISLVTSSLGFGLYRSKRNSVKIGDLPQIRPPTALKAGEKKYPNPGWTHCIKYLTAAVGWRSIKSVNIKKLQATQFQCSWYISSEVPGTQIRLSFEKLDLGVDHSSACSQQFLELIDIKAGKSQARMCGNKRYGDYVSAGQRVRIDIQGEEPLVEKLRMNKEPFIINYKLVREPAGFRVGGSPKHTELKNKVKTSLGSVVRPVVGDRGKNIFGSKNQPGANDPKKKDETTTDRRTSLTIWQVIIIIVITIAIVACVVGVIVKRTIFDKKKKEEYLKFEDLNVENGSKVENNTLPLPGVSPPSYSTVSKPANKKKKPDILSDLPRSNSKPETSEKKKTNHVRRHNSLGDVDNNPKVTKHRKASNDVKSGPETKHTYTNVPFKKPTENEKAKTLPPAEKIVDDTPLSRAPRKEKVPENVQKPGPKVHHGKNGVVKKKHKTNRSKTDVKNNDKDSVSAPKSRPKRNHSPKKKATEPKPISGTKLPDISATEVQDDTPSSRPEKVAKKSPEKQPKVTSPRTKNNNRKPEENKPANQNGHKKREHSNRDAKPKGSTKRPKTVSSAHKKATTTNGKVNSSRNHASSNKKKRPGGEEKGEKSHRRKRDNTASTQNDKTQVNVKRTKAP